MTTEHTPGRPWAASIAGLRIDRLCVSFQRFEYVPGHQGVRAPPSLGVLPVATTPGGFAVPVADGEAFWIGVDGTELRHPESITVDAICTDGRKVRVADFMLASFAVIPGIVGTHESFEVFRREWLAQLYIRARNATAHVIPMDPAAYAACTGQAPPPPIDRSAGYRGWRLP